MSVIVVVVDAAVVVVVVFGRSEQRNFEGVRGLGDGHGVGEWSEVVEGGVGMRVCVGVGLGRGQC